MRIEAITGSKASATEQHLLERMHELRAKVFGNRLGWDVRIERNQERDEYDRLDPTYLVLVDAPSQVIGCARLLPTVGPTMLAQTFPALAGASPPPRSRKIVESSRFCIDAEHRGDVSVNGLREATHTLLAGTIEWSMANGYNRILTVTDIRFERILLRAKWPLHRLAEPQTVGNTKAVAGILPADKASFMSVRPSRYTPIYPTLVDSAA